MILIYHVYILLFSVQYTFFNNNTPHSDQSWTVLFRLMQRVYTQTKLPPPIHSLLSAVQGQKAVTAYF